MKYSIIYTDPPWRYNARGNTKTRFGGGAMGHYETMSLDEIKALPVLDIAGDNSALFMWVTAPQLDRQAGVISAWGFRFVTVAFTWIKTNPKDGRPFFGVGHYTKSNPEFCLLGIRGKMPVASNRVSSVIIAPRREHSRKPDEARDRIVQLFGDVPRVELFARETAPGWESWGFGVGKAGTLTDLTA